MRKTVTTKIHSMNGALMLVELSEDIDHVIAICTLPTKLQDDMREISKRLLEESAR